MEKRIINSLDKVVKNLRLSLTDLRCIDNALQYIDIHYSDKISADGLSMEVGLSKDKLQAGLQCRTGKTLHKYIQEVRLAKARELLANTNDPLKSVADASGFVNESHFCKVFKKMHLISPVQYRYQQVV
jgi:AraC-like DNA-binding protein